MLQVSKTTGKKRLGFQLINRRRKQPQSIKKDDQAPATVNDQSNPPMRGEDSLDRSNNLTFNNKSIKMRDSKNIYDSWGIKGFD